jgi:hypothetical protein
MATKTMTAVGNAQLDTAQKKFGTASGLFDGTGDYLTTPDDTAWAFGTGNFTIDFWFRLPSVAGNLAYAVCGQKDSASQFWAVDVYVNGASSGLIFHSITGGVWKINIAATYGAFSADTWYHGAVVRNGTAEADWHFFINGTEIADSLSLGSYANAVHDGTGVLNVAGNGGASGADFAGWLDEVRIVKGTAVWTSNFTAPSAEYAYNTASGTELLLHMNGTDASTTFLDSSGATVTHFLSTLGVGT